MPGRRSYSRSFDKRDYRDDSRGDMRDDRGYRDGRGRDDGHRGYHGGGYRSRSPPRGGYRGRDGGGPRLNTENQIYVARFNRRTTESDLRRAFEKYGYIEKIDLKDGRGFGFIVSTHLKRATARYHRSAKYSEQKNSCITYYQALMIELIMLCLILK